MGVRVEKLAVSYGPEESGEVIENRCGETDIIDLVQDAGVTLDQSSGVGHTTVAFDGAHRHRSRTGHHGHDRA